MKRIRTVVEVIFAAAALALLFKTAIGSMEPQEKIFIVLIVLVGVSIVVVIHRR